MLLVLDKSKLPVANNFNVLWRLKRAWDVHKNLSQHYLVSRQRKVWNYITKSVAYFKPEHVNELLYTYYDFNNSVCC